MFQYCLRLKPSWTFTWLNNDVFCLTYLLGFRQRRNQLQQFAIRLNIIQSEAKMNAIKWSSNLVAQPNPDLTQKSATLRANSLASLCQFYDGLRAILGGPGCSRMKLELSPAPTATLHRISGDKYGMDRWNKSVTRYIKLDTSNTASHNSLIE